MRYDHSGTRKGAPVATKSEITDAIRVGMNRVEATFSQLSDEQLATRVHDEPGGWTAYEVLAHLSGRQDTYELLIEMARTSNGATPGTLDIDSWNQRLVNSRRDRSLDDLLREFRRTHEGLIERTHSLRDDQLALRLVLPNGERTLGEVLLGSGGMHSIQHAKEVAEALGIEQE
jgi:hypothetical protein